MTLYNCIDCRRWHSGIGHVCGDPLPKIRDQRSLESAVVKAARAFLDKMGDPTWLDGVELAALMEAINELDGLDRPLLTDGAD